jgi:cytochrome bd-type quinol oxidase subunit 2
LFLSPKYYSFAQGTALDELQNVGEASQLPGGGSGQTAGAYFTVFIIRIIENLLYLLGVYFLCLMLYAGYLWMSSQGEKTKIEKAQHIFRNATIGVLVIFLSLSITNFVADQILGGIE